MARTIPIRQGGMVRAAPSLPALRRIGVEEVGHALRLGFDDFMARPTHVIFLAVIYPIIGLLLAYATVGQNVIPLLYPLLAGFALVGPFAALGLYEISRRRELGETPTWRDAFGIVRATSFRSMAALGMMLVAIFACWLAAAQIIYLQTLVTPPASFADLANRVLFTREGWLLIVIGNGVGFLFAALALSISVLSFPLMLDRHADLATAVRTSVRAVTHNPAPMILWGMIVAGGLVIGSLPFLIGLALVLPILGHATWHLYRIVVV